MILNIASNLNFILQDSLLKAEDNSKFIYSISSDMLTINDLSTKKQILFPDHVVNKNSNIYDLLIESDINKNVSSKIVLTDIKFDLIFLSKGKISILDDNNIIN